MPKRKTPARKPKDITLRLTFIIIGSFFLILFASIFFIRQNHPCANSLSCIDNLTGQKEATNEGTYMGKAVRAPEIDEDRLYALTELKAVLGDSTEGSKHIYVDLSKQRLYAYDGPTMIYDFPVSTGKWNPTPTGDFRIWIWLRYTRMTGGNMNDGSYYNLPNVPYTMYFWNSVTPKHWGYGIHGAYWHNNFGHPMSHGCINMRIEDAGKLFYWTNPNVKHTAYASEKTPGTPITIYGTTPKE